ncbi:efflux RND transporter periplasmic adaptor subunit [uncultured Thiodictyon sp.]|uniref:efflux RND transporter periplasmic adaptor subunit n=1 Tax=uncultured Thiodictyon sp. TaxID=1846217 RepID=UPI0025EAD84D|nr:efflux RND transporter periplasmic adaptor subunit [uncultured Thiodictyon sp.]
MRSPWLAIALIAPIGLAGCADADQPSAASSPSLHCAITVVKTGALPTLYRLPGTVVSDDRIDLSSRLVGLIAHLEVREGQRVAKGELVVQIDPSGVNDAIRQGEAGVGAARNELSDTQEDADKYAGLAAKGYASTEALRKARVRRDLARALLDKAESTLAAARAQRTYADIRSPVDGIVVARHGHVGELAAAGAPILTLESRQALVLRVFVAEGQVGGMAPGGLVGVRIDALPDQAIQGRVQRIVPSGDPATRRYQVDIALPPQSPGVLPGMFGRAELVLGERPALLIPCQSLVSRGGIDGVFVVDQGNRAQLRWVRLGPQWQRQIEVVAGLNAGERILAQVDDRVRDGLLIADGPND